MGRTARPYGVHQLSGAIRDLRLDLQRLWSRPIRPPRRSRGTGDRGSGVRRAGGVQRIVAGPLSIRSCRVALALVHVWGTAADAATAALGGLAIMIAPAGLRKKVRRLQLAASLMSRIWHKADAAFTSSAVRAARVVKGKRPSNSTSKLKLRNVRINRIQPFENQFIISFGFTSLNSRSSIRRLPAYAPSIMPVTVSQCPLPATASQPFLAAQRATAATTSAAAIGMALSFVFADEPDSNLSFSSVAECG
jgi:hypothetical protein